MRERRPIELLSPARDIATAKEAILHGADAVYIGAPRFGARAAAGNTIDDIATLVEYAHFYRVKVYVALNTILRDDELAEAEKIIHDLYRAGVDALIIQDMAIMKLDIPPIPLHASTQCDNDSIQKVRFLQEAGFTQVVLARELTLKKIKEIADNTAVPLEVFIHGALCVSYSGRCYLSRALSGRSANRGECAQCCRLPYELSDAQGNTLVKEAYLLSLKDMNRGEYLEELLDAGVTSLKIEGRLKDAAYVKNITAYYRQLLDGIFARRSEYRRSSAGKSEIKFTPDPNKSFNRGFTPYFSDMPSFKTISSRFTPKSTGEYIGTLTGTNGRGLKLTNASVMHNGDGVLYKTPQGEVGGFRVNRVSEDTIYPAEEKKLPQGTEIYRNYDSEFEKQLSQPTAERHIPITAELSYNGRYLVLQLIDDEGITIKAEETLLQVEAAKQPQDDNQHRQLSKLGGTGYKAEETILHDTGKLFIPSSQLAALRRKAVADLTTARSKKYTREKPGIRNTPAYPQKKLTYTANIYNTAAEQFYKECGVESISPAYEANPEKGVPLMHTKYCIRREFGQCPQNNQKAEWKSPLWLKNGNTRLRLDFDCKQCIMTVTKP